MTLAPIVFGVIGVDVATSERLVQLLDTAGVMAAVCTEATAIAGALACDALLFNLGDRPEELSHVARALGHEPRLRRMPRILRVSSHVAVERVAPFGWAVIVPTESLDHVLVDAVAEAVVHIRAGFEEAQNRRKADVAIQASERTSTLLCAAAATLSHDARVLMDIVLGFASNLRDEIAGPTSDTQRAHAMRIVEASADATALLERYTASVRQAALEESEARRALNVASRQVERRRQTDLDVLVRRSVALLEGMAATKQLDVTVSVASALPHPWCDPVQIKQVLMNALSNALKFTPAGRAVKILVASRVPDPSGEGAAAARQAIEIVVSDSGPGIPVEYREHVFGRGVRLERDRQVPGSGLGLSMVRDIMIQHGGSARFEDSPVGGARLVLTIPSDLRWRSDDRTQRSSHVVPRGGP